MLDQPGSSWGVFSHTTAPEAFRFRRKSAPIGMQVVQTHTKGAMPQMTWVGQMHTMAEHRQDQQM